MEGEELKYKIKKYSGVRGWTSRFFFISKDEFGYKKKEEDNRGFLYQIAQLDSSSVVFDNGKTFFLYIKIKPNIELKISEENQKENKTIVCLNQILNSKKIIYFIKELQFFYERKILMNFKVQEYTQGIELYINNERSREIQEKLDNNRDKIRNLFELVQKNFNAYSESMNSHFESLNIEDRFEKMKNFDEFQKELEENPQNRLLVERKDFHKESISTLHMYHVQLVKLLCSLKERVASSVYRQNFTFKPLVQDRADSNVETNLKIGKIKEENEELRKKLTTLLNKNSVIKDECKKILVGKNKKLFLCYRCGNMLQKTNFTEPTCSFDERCMERIQSFQHDKAEGQSLHSGSLFFCKKCKIHFCTYCIVLQRYLKCPYNHSLYPAKQSDFEGKNAEKIEVKKLKCLGCNKELELFKFFYCSYCKIKICFDCSKGKNGKENTCWNCSNELVWQRGIRSQCNKCSKWRQCYWNCYYCDYLICLECYSVPGNNCGGFHRLEVVDLEKERSDRERIDKVGKFKNNFEMKFYGKCSRCNHTIHSGKISMCLRCNLFLCTVCINQMGIIQEGV